MCTHLRKLAQNRTVEQKLESLQGNTGYFQHNGKSTSEEKKEFIKFYDVLF